MKVLIELEEFSKGTLRRIRDEIDDSDLLQELEKNKKAKVLVNLEELSRRTLVKIASETSDSKILDELARNVSAKVRIAVASNGWTRLETMKKLTKDSDRAVADAAAKTLRC